MISFKDFLNEKTAIAKFAGKDEDNREKIFQKAKSFALSAWLKNAKKTNKNVTNSDAPEKIRNPENKGALMSAISSWKASSNLKISSLWFI